MTIRQVLLNGAGTSGDGTTWNDLSDATSAFIGTAGFVTALNASAGGDTVYVKGSSALGASQTWSGGGAVGNPVRVLGCKPATTNNQGSIVQSDLIPGFRTGASVFAFDDADIPALVLNSTNDLTANDCSAYVYGIKFDIPDNLLLNQREEAQVFEECWFELNSSTDLLFLTGQSQGNVARYINCKALLPSGSLVTAGWPLEWIGGEFGKSGGTTGIFGNTAQETIGSTWFKGTDFSNSVDVNLVTIAHAQGLVIFQNCRFPASHSLTTGASVGKWRVEAYGCEETASGISTSEQAFEIASHEGTVDVETVITRSGGADDEAEGPYSHDMTTLAGNTTPGYNSLYGPWMGKQVTNLGSPGQTLEVFFTSDIGNTQSADWDDDDVWLEVLYPDDAGGSKFDYATTQMTLLGTPSAVASDPDSSWTGGSPSLTKNNQKIQAPIQAGYEGPVHCRVHFAPGANAETIYVCPDIGVV